MNRKTKDMCFVAIMAALLCIAGPNTIPLGPIHLTLANFVILLAGYLLGSKKGTMVVALYLLIGLIGVPVFSGYTGGFGKLVSPSFGFLLGDIPCVFITGLARDHFAEKKYMAPVLMVIGTAVLYCFGTVWFVFVAGTTLMAALQACVLPFVVIDTAKIVAATVVGILVERPLEKMLAA